MIATLLFGKIQLVFLKNMNELKNYFLNAPHRLIYKWNSYFDAYEKHFSKYTNQHVKILEIGVFKGGSLQMWKNYFGPQSKIIGMDLNPECAQYEEDQIEIFIGDQSNISDLSRLVEKYKNFDIIIDDGSHINEHQIKTFEFLFDYLNFGGIYLVEDTHTSYWNNYGGGYKNNNSFIEFSKNLIDDINGYSMRPNARVTKYTNIISDIHINYGMIFFEKNKIKFTPYDIGIENGKIVKYGEIQWKNKVE